MGSPQDDVESEWCNFNTGTIHTGSAPVAVLREWCRPWNYTIPTAATWMGGLGSIYGATAPVRIYDAEFRNQNKGFLGTNGVC